MILADTSIWVDHFRYNNRLMNELLTKRSILCHPFVVAELSLGSIQSRQKTLAFLDEMPRATVAFMDEVREMIEVHSLYSQGIGLIDAHLLASVRIDSPTLLWTTDKRLRRVASSFGVCASFPEAHSLMEFMAE